MPPSSSPFQMCADHTSDHQAPNCHWPLTRVSQLSHPFRPRGGKTGVKKTPSPDIYFIVTQWMNPPGWPSTRYC